MVSFSPVGGPWRNPALSRRQAGRLRRSKAAGPPSRAARLVGHAAPRHGRAARHHRRRHRRRAPGADGVGRRGRRRARPALRSPRPRPPPHPRARPARLGPRADRHGPRSRRTTVHVRRPGPRGGGQRRGPGGRGGLPRPRAGATARGRAPRRVGGGLPLPAVGGPPGRRAGPAARGHPARPRCLDRGGPGRRRPARAPGPRRHHLRDRGRAVGRRAGAGTLRAALRGGARRRGAARPRAGDRVRGDSAIGLARPASAWPGTGARR